MVANWVKVIWILIGGTVAAAGAAYVGGVFEPAPVSAPIEAAVQQPEASDGEDAAASDEAAAGVETAGDDEQQMASLPASGEEPDAAQPGGEPASAPDLIVPAFDLVRVEPDGSVVIAGNAAPNSTVELIVGASVIGTAQAGASGDFAVVLDEPLKPGDYTVVLRSTGEDDVVTMSAQTAIIAVPETDSGQVLALVEEPGAPSRLITVPSAPEPKEEVETAAKGDRPAAAGAEGGAQMTDAPEAKPEPETQAAAEAPANDAGSAPKASETAEIEAAPTEEQQMAAAEKPAEAAEPAATPAQTPRIAVEAVEIEGRKVFVAGRAEAGTTVRVYANDILLGQAVASDGGRFLIEAEKDLPVGDYIVRADMLSSDNADVVARAAVPFEREPGEKLAAVAAVAPVESAVQQPKREPGAEAGGETMAAQDAPEVSPATDDKPAGEMAADATPKAGDTGSASMAAGESDAREDADKPATMAALDDSGEGSADDGGNEAVTAEPTAPKLQNVSGAVIIRRGDTLWQLSRRVYGRGVRYTTIYLANQEQIADPDMIWPGQVFSVPGETDEGEEADMSADAEQVADPDEMSEEVVTR